MDQTTELQRVRSSSSDPDNPSVEELVRLLRNAERIAVVGMSRDPEKPARRIPSFLLANGYDVVPVNPNADRILGRTSHAALADVPPPIDLVLLFRPSDRVSPFIEQALEREDKPAIWLQTGITAPEAVAAARAAGRMVIQDLCIFRVRRVLDD